MYKTHIKSQPPKLVNFYPINYGSFSYDLGNDLF